MVDRDYFPNPGCFGLLAFCVLLLSILACGTQIPTKTSTAVPAVAAYQQIAVKAVITSEPTEAAPVYVTTAPLNVRAEANADSTILGTLPKGTEVTIFVLDIRGDDCYMGEWYAIESPIAGFVCSLYVEVVDG